MGEVIWGMNDCWNFLAPGCPRLPWLADCVDEGDAMMAGIKHYGSRLKMYRGVATDLGFKQVLKGLPGDRVIGIDKYVGVVAGVVQPDYMVHIRTHTGQRAAQFGSINSIWRPPCHM